VFTASLVTGRTIGIGAYLVRLGQVRINACASMVIGLSVE
jgi:acetyl-CoA carboxylase carboxyltransferase component